MDKIIPALNIVTDLLMGKTNNNDGTEFFDGCCVRVLSESDFDPNKPGKLIHNNKSQCSIVLFYAHWCPHCVTFVKTWKRLAEFATCFDVCSFSCNRPPIHSGERGNIGYYEVLKTQCSGLINGFPTIVIYSGDSAQFQYEGDRTLVAMTQACIDSCNLEECVVCNDQGCTKGQPLPPADFSEELTNICSKAMSQQPQGAKECPCKKK